MSNRRRSCELEVLAWTGVLKLQRRSHESPSNQLFTPASSSSHLHLLQSHHLAPTDPCRTFKHFIVQSDSLSLSLSHIHCKLSDMADVEALEQRFDSISVQDENLDTNAAIAAQHKQKVHYEGSSPFEILMLTSTPGFPFHRNISLQSWRRSIHQPPQTPPPKDPNQHPNQDNDPNIHNKNHPPIPSRPTTANPAQLRLKPQLRSRPHRPPPKRAQTESETMASRHVRDRQTPG